MELSSNVVDSLPCCIHFVSSFVMLLHCVQCSFFNYVFDGIWNLHFRFVG